MAPTSVVRAPVTRRRSTGARMGVPGDETDALAPPGVRPPGTRPGPRAQKERPCAKSGCKTLRFHVMARARLARHPRIRVFESAVARSSTSPRTRFRERGTGAGVHVVRAAGSRRGATHHSMSFIITDVSSRPSAPRWSPRRTCTAGASPPCSTSNARTRRRVAHVVHQLLAELRALLVRGTSPPQGRDVRASVRISLSIAAILITGRTPS